jgi:hypothetical protein
MSVQVHVPATLPTERSLHTLRVEGWLDTIASLIVVTKENVFAPSGKQIPVIQLAVNHVTKLSRLIYVSQFTVDHLITKSIYVPV